jgi:mRNA-degrading endonuclease toxin of MazEF toxin-antitoxin module
MSTSPAQGRRGPTVVELPAGSAGLSKASLAVCHQVTTLDRAKLARKAGALPPGILLEVEGALKAAMDIE